MASSSWVRRTTPVVLEIPSPRQWVELPDADTADADYGFLQPRFDYRLTPDADLDHLFLDLLKDDDIAVVRAAAATVRVDAVIPRLLRLADIRQTRFQGKPAPDGTNLHTEKRTHVAGRDLSYVNGSAELRDMWSHHKDVLEYLHSQKLIDVRADHVDYADQVRLGFIELDYHSRDEMIRHMRWGTRHFQDRETAKLATATGGPALQEGLDWLILFQIAIDDAVAAFNAAFVWCRRYGKDLHAAMTKVWAGISPITRLILLLIDNEETFETRMMHEHVFDMLIDKRIHMFDHRDAINNVGTSVALGIARRQMEAVRDDLYQYQQRISGRFDYLRLVDWGYGRIFEKLFLVVPKLDDVYTAAVASFRAWANSGSQLAYDLLQVHPMSEAEIPKDEVCVICYTGYTPLQLVMQLRCGHRFHPKCIVDWWDRDNHFSNNCVACTQSVGTLRNRLTFDAQYQDICYTQDTGRWAHDQGADAVVMQALQTNTDIRDLDPNTQEVFWRRVTQLLLERERLRRKQERADQKWAVLDGPSDLAEDHDASTNWRQELDAVPALPGAADADAANHPPAG